MIPIQNPIIPEARFLKISDFIRKLSYVASSSVGNISGMTASPELAVL